MKVSRNDPCPCGSGKKFKRCCLDKSYGGNTSDLNRATLLERNRTLIDAIIDILQLKKRDWKDMKRELSNEQVREVFQVVASLWPSRTNLSPLLPAPDGKLRGLFLGLQRPESILENVLRYSLYSDEIVIVSPFTPNPNCIVEKYNPIVHPEMYKAHLLRVASMLLQLAPWIANGIVILMPDPGDFDYSLRTSTWEAARQRWKQNPLNIEEDQREYERYFKEDLLRTMARLPHDVLRDRFKRANAELDDARAEAAIEQLHEIMRQDPLALDQIWSGTSQMDPVSSGANLEMGLYIAQMTGSYLFTNMQARWSEILSVAPDSTGDAETWSSLTHAFQRLEFKFLDGVPLKLALDMRASGRLEMLRNVLRKIWVEVGGNADASRAEGLARDFGDELKQRVAEAEADWEKIDAELVKWAGATAAAGLSGVAGVVPGSLTVKLGGIGLALVTELLNARLKRRRFAKSVPLSLLLELKRRK